jgi:hypothetical protein
VIHFEKSSSAKTALMVYSSRVAISDPPLTLLRSKLNGGTLDGATLIVNSDTVHQDEHHDDHTKPIEQSDKPRAGSELVPPRIINPR